MDQPGQVSKLLGWLKQRRFFENLEQLLGAVPAVTFRAADFFFTTKIKKNCYLTYSARNEIARSLISTGMPGQDLLSPSQHWRKVVRFEG